MFLASAGAWSAYVVSRRAFLRDFNRGVHAYLAGSYLEAEQELRKALERKPRDAEVRQLLTKTLIEQSFAQYHQKDFDGAMETLIARRSRLWKPCGSNLPRRRTSAP
jgi:predicted negative regulator of RcsB-dependent stress response